MAKRVKCDVCKAEIVKYGSNKEKYFVHCHKRQYITDDNLIITPLAEISEPSKAVKRDKTLKIKKEEQLRNKTERSLDISLEKNAKALGGADEQRAEQTIKTEMSSSAREQLKASVMTSNEVIEPITEEVLEVEVEESSTEKDNIKYRCKDCNLDLPDNKFCKGCNYQY